ncbi:hypothetical protein MMC08_007113 [Hypocenomyce scalaris]|nr:hypothetical protein [Hypocenomyce scalaris]
MGSSHSRPHDSIRGIHRTLYGGEPIPGEGWVKPSRHGHRGFRGPAAYAGHGGFGGQKGDDYTRMMSGMAAMSLGGYVVEQVTGGLTGDDTGEVV